MERDRNEDPEHVVVRGGGRLSDGLTDDLEEGRGHCGRDVRWRGKDQEEWDQEDIVVGCEVDNKDPTRHGVVQYGKDFDLQATSKKLKNDEADLVKADAKMVNADPDKKQYKASKVKKGAVDYVETQCTVAITLDDRVKQ